MRIYVASSWRNKLQPALVSTLRAAGYEVYDFRNPEPGNDGFRWSEIDEDWQLWTPDQYIAALDHPIAHRGYALDKAGMDWADACVLLLPSGRSAHLEAGYMAGQGKPVVAFIPEPVEPELMNKLLTRVVTTSTALSRVLHEWSSVRAPGASFQPVGVVEGRTVVFSVDAGGES